MERLDIINPIAGGPIFFLEETTSTMETAKKVVETRRERGETIHGTVVWADYQSLGRGRFSHRRWYAERGTNLLFTLVLDAEILPTQMPPLSLLAGLALTEAMEEVFSLNLLIKWPNDLVCRGRKIAGILTEHRDKTYYIGIGMNCNQTRFSGGENYTFPPGSLKHLVGEVVNRRVCLSSMLKQLSLYLTSWDLRPPRISQWKEEIEKRLYNRGKVVTLTIGDPQREEHIQGWIWGIDDQGALLIKTENEGIRKVISGEIGIP